MPQTMRTSRESGHSEQPVNTQAAPSTSVQPPVAGAQSSNPVKNDFQECLQNVWGIYCKQMALIRDLKKKKGSYNEKLFKRVMNQFVKIHGKEGVASCYANDFEGLVEDTINSMESEIDRLTSENNRLTSQSVESFSSLVQVKTDLSKAKEDIAMLNSTKANVETTSLKLTVKDLREQLSRVEAEKLASEERAEQKLVSVKKRVKEYCTAVSKVYGSTIFLDEGKISRMLKGLDEPPKDWDLKAWRRDIKSNLKSSLNFIARSQDMYDGVVTEEFNKLTKIFNGGGAKRKAKGSESSSPRPKRARKQTDHYRPPKLQDLTKDTKDSSQTESPQPQPQPQPHPLNGFPEGVVSARPKTNVPGEGSVGAPQ